MPRAFALMGLVAGGASLALVALLSLWAVHCLASAAGAVEGACTWLPAASERSSSATWAHIWAHLEAWC